MKIFCFEREFPWLSYEDRMKLISEATWDAMGYESPWQLL